MKKALLIVVWILLAITVAYYGMLFISHKWDINFLLVDKCLDMWGAWNEATKQCDKDNWNTTWSNDDINMNTDNVRQENYSGQVWGKQYMFSHSSTATWNTYQLISAYVTTSWNYNTERWFWDDENATVFVLNFDKPESEQKKLVRLSTKSGVIFWLSGDKIDQSYALYSVQ